MAARADAQKYVGFRNVELLEKDFGHFEIVMLASVNEATFETLISFQVPHEMCDLDEIWPCSGDYNDPFSHSRTAFCQGSLLL
jgi:hypothetical protein